MGLDMYLTKRTYVGANYPHRNVMGVITLSAGTEPIKVTLERVSEIIEQIGYWRKANAIHKWFVDNCQGGTDDCREAYADEYKLKELLSICQRIKEKPELAELLPPQSGFFFGSTDIDEGYMSDIDDTIKILTEALEEEGGDFYYHSSW